MIKVLPVKLTGYPPRRMKGVQNEIIRKDIPSGEVIRKMGDITNIKTCY